MTFRFLKFLPVIQIGGFGNDSIAGSGRRDIVIDIFGDDTIDTGSGNDKVKAGFGDDVIIAGSGDNSYDGGHGNDRIEYEGGIDHYSGLPTGKHLHRPFTLTRHDDAPEGAGEDRIKKVEQIYFRADDYTYHLDGTNNAVLAGDDTMTASEDGTTTISAATLLANDREFDGDAIAITEVSGTSAAGATVSFAGGTITYDPGTLFDALGEGETATDTFTYLVDDGKGGTDTATVTVTITGRNDAPALIAPEAVTYAENGTDPVAIIAASDVEGDTVTLTLAGADAALFTLDAATGALHFNAAPDYEAPADAGGDNVYDLTIVADDGNGGITEQALTVTVTDVEETPPTTARLNEIHYDDAGTDEGEFIEVRVAAGEDVSALRVELYNGNGGGVYGSVALTDMVMTSDGTHDYYVWNAPVNGIQNGAPDGFALVNGESVVEFFSYEGEMTATEGAAAGLTSTDMGVAEAGDPEGLSLWRDAEGVWHGPDAATPGADNEAVPPLVARLNEIHYDNAGTDEGEFIEVRVGAGTDVSAMSVELYNGNGGALYNTIALTDMVMTSAGGYDYYVWNAPVNGIQNGAPDGFALVNAGAVVEFFSYEGEMTATSGTAAGMTSTDMGVSEPGDTPVRQSLWRDADGVWQGPDAATPGAENEGAAPVVARLNEIHYDDAGTDEGEFIEVRVAAGGDVSALSVELYNGNGGGLYGTVALADMAMTSDGTYDYYVWNAPVNGIQNGAPDGFALVNGGTVVEFFSYEGEMTATGGSAAGMTSVDMGVAEAGEAEGMSLWRDDAGVWHGPDAATPGAANEGGAPAGLVINELAVNTTGTDWEFAEFHGTPGMALDGYALLQVADDGYIYSVVDLSGGVVGDNGFFLAASPEAGGVFGVTPDLAIDNNTFTNSPATFLLVSGYDGSVGEGGDLDTDDDGVIDVTPYASIADKVALIDGSSPRVYEDAPVVGPDGSYLAAGAQRSEDGGGSFTMTPFGDASAYTPTAGGAGGGGGGDPVATTIAAVQGSGASSTMVDQLVTVEGIVVGDFQNGDADDLRNLGGFFIQMETGDGDAATSDGIFVYQGSGASAFDVALGDKVKITGTVAEFFGKTQIAASGIEMLEAGAVADVNTMAQTITLGTGTDLEAHEGMLVTVDQTLTVNEAYNLDRFGEIRVTAGDRPAQFTQENAPDVAGYAAHVAEVQANQIIYDDGRSVQNPAEIIPDYDLNGDGVFDTSDGFGMGDTVTGLTGVLDYSFDEWRIHSVEDDANTFVDTGTRQEMPPEVGGDLKVVSFNVLNYFATTVESGGSSGPSNLEPRGADDAAELLRQTEKLVTTIAAMDADVYGLVELENNFIEGSDGNAIAKLVAELNTYYQTNMGATGDTWDWVRPGADYVGDDAIAVGMIYKVDNVAVVPGSVDFLTDADLDALGYGHLDDDGLGVFSGAGTNRSPLTATFTDLTGSGEEFTVTVVHMKSKGSGSGSNADMNDGAGASNEMRLEGVEVVKAWLDAVADADSLVLGDFNAYAKEDPIAAMEAAGYTNLEGAYEGGSTYVFDGQTGTLDYAFASSGAMDNVTGAAAWHINSDEPDIYDYNLNLDSDAAYERDPAIFDGSVPWRTSDHDPVIVGLDFDDPIAVA